MKRLIDIFLIALVSVCAPLAQAETLRVYGPGGPAPAMKEAAEVFSQKTKNKVEVTAGPTPQWIDTAKRDADLIFSGAENMMTDFVGAMEGRISDADVLPLYLRPMAMLVRPGNPKKIADVKDLLKPGLKVLVVNGSGQAGAWEDIAGRKGDIKTVRTLRKNIVSYAKNSGEAKQTWIDRPEIDVWLIWNVWQVASPTLADVVDIAPEYAIYRDAGVVVTTQGKTKPAAQQFIEFLQGPEGARIFKKWGWKT